MATIILTGANGNLGLSVTNRLLNDGYSIVTVSGSGGAGNLPNSPALKNYEVDLFDDRQAGEFVKSIISQNPDLQAAVLLVGGFAMGKLSETDPESLEKMIRLNFHTAFHIVRHLMPHFMSRNEGGQFILIGSRPGLDPAQGTNFFAYALSKAMVFKLAEFVNAEGKGKNVTATVIVPSTIDTPANRQAMPDADFSRWVAPQNIADAISFSLSDTGRMMKETVIKIYNRS